jgi:hypothetical protein
VHSIGTGAFDDPEPFPLDWIAQIVPLLRRKRSNIDGEGARTACENRAWGHDTIGPRRPASADWSAAPKIIVDLGLADRSDEHAAIDLQRRLLQGT